MKIAARDFDAVLDAILNTALLFTCAAFMWLLFMERANAQTYGTPALVDHNAPGHWYPPSCCSQRDCEPVPIDGVEETKNGWQVRYISKRLGSIDEEVPREHARVKVNEHDGAFHGCWRIDYPSRLGAASTSGNYLPTPKRMICFFYPVNM